MMAELEISKSLVEINNKVSSIQQLLQGHELDKDDKGMVGIQNDHERRVVKLERTVDKVVYMMIGMSIPATAGVIVIIKNLFTFLIHK